MPTLEDLLRSTVELDGSDLHVTAGSSPQVRVHGELRALDLPRLVADDTRELAFSALSDGQRRRFEDARELDCSFGVRGVGRFRCNVFRQSGAVAAVYRRVPETIRGLGELGLPPVIERWAERPRGLVLVTGPTGSGKSATLAALIDRINTQRRAHILTIEDPIEYVHPHKRSLVNQRELHSDTASFSAALRAALREDPDVVLIGELRDFETIEAAFRIAETGHLTLATVHTNSAYQTINRLVDAFPDSRQDRARGQLALLLEGVVCQALLPGADGRGRVAAAEVLSPTPAVRNLIRENKVHQMYSAMQAGQGRHGMQTMNDALARLYLNGEIGLEAALGSSSDPAALLRFVGEPAPEGVDQPGTFG
jgi:twitching motility protein PilT